MSLFDIFRSKKSKLAKGKKDPPSPTGENKSAADMAPPAADEVAPSVTNAAHGETIATQGESHKIPGSVNGLAVANGVNGAATNGINGHGKTNGTTNGTTNGVNGHGETNGATNGINGVNAEEENDANTFHYGEVVPEGTPYRVVPQYHSKPTKLRVACVGAGASGLCLAYKMEKMLIPGSWELTLFEKNPHFGGTWYENRYPGVACDVSPQPLSTWKGHRRADGA